jgi:hypothetical protein
VLNVDGSFSCHSSLPLSWQSLYFFRVA